VSAAPVAVEGGSGVPEGAAVEWCDFDSGRRQYLVENIEAATFADRCKHLMALENRWPSDHAAFGPNYLAEEVCFRLAKSNRSDGRRIDRDQRGSPFSSYR
jgi:hypothetical protein